MDACPPVLRDHQLTNICGEKRQNIENVFCRLLFTATF